MLAFCNINKMARKLRTIDNDYSPLVIVCVLIQGTILHPPTTFTCKTNSCFERINEVIQI